MNLYEITKEIALLEIGEAEELSAEELHQRLDGLKTQRDEKLANICALIKNIDADAEALRAEEKRLKEKREQVERRVEWLKSWLAYNVARGEKWKNGVHAIGWRKSEAVTQDTANPQETPACYLRTKTVIEPAKDEIKRDIKAGATVPGWHIEERWNLQIK